MPNITIQDFAGTGIKTPFEKMRANAIINAGNDKQGLSMIDYNITNFLGYGRRDDALYILSLWAIIPITKNAARFQQHPEAGCHALTQRMDFLLDHFSRREDMKPAFLEEARDKMTEAIYNEIALATGYSPHSQSA